MNKTEAAAATDEAEAAGAATEADAAEQEPPVEEPQAEDAQADEPQAQDAPVEDAPVEESQVDAAKAEEPAEAESPVAGATAAEPPEAGQLPVYMPPPLSPPPPPPAGVQAASPIPATSSTTTAFVPQAVPPVDLEPPHPRRRRRRAWLIGVPMIVVTVLAVFFASSTVFDATEGTEAAPAATRSSAPPLLTSEAYQQMLASADAALAVAFQQFAAAPGPAALDSTATALALAIDAETDKLAAVRPPEAASEAHQLLVGGLTRLQWEPAGVDIEGRIDGASCTGPAGAASVARTAAADQVRTAVERLKTVDARYVFGSFLPATSELQSRRMGNGAYLKRTSTNGSGLLKVNNDGSKDTAVSLVLVGETAPRLTVYVQGKSSFTARGITDGNYAVFTTAGVDWDPAMRVFSRDCEFTKFRDPLEFKTNSGTYTEWTITLTPTESGNAPVEDVDPGTYPTG